MKSWLSGLVDLVGEAEILTGDNVSDDYAHDEALSGQPCMPAAVVRPQTAEQVSQVLCFATAHGIPVTARGSGTGLSGACVARPDGIVVSFERMKRILEIDTRNHIAVAQAGVTLEQLNTATAEEGLVYPVYPGENSASLGGNVATNAGGMRAVKYGVTRHHVLGLEAVLATGEIVRTGGKLVKTSTGYDLTQLIIGSEGTLAVVTEVTVGLVPLLPRHATLLAPFRSLAKATAAVPALIVSGVGPVMVEYIDRLTMMAITAQSSLELGVPGPVEAETQAYLVVVLEGRSGHGMEEDMETAGGVLAGHEAIDVYVLPPNAATQLVEAREKSFWAAKQAPASEVVDIVVPRASLPEYMEKVHQLAMQYGTVIPGCGHAGDGNVHLAVFEQDKDKQSALLRDLFSAGRQLGGVVSGEHGIGRLKKKYFVELEDPVKIALMRRIKQAFDPAGVLNPGAIFD